MYVSVVFSASPSINITIIVLDRSNLGNARLLGLPGDVLGGDASGKLFDWINSAFFFSYVRPLTFLYFPSCSDLNFPDYLSNTRYSYFQTLPSTALACWSCHRLGSGFNTLGKYVWLRPMLSGQ